MSHPEQLFPLSVVILARNEERNIERCIRSVNWCDDIVVVDDGSTDRTRELSERAGARVVDHRFESFARQRNWALEHADLKNDWVLMLDADEESSDAFRDDVIRHLSNVDDSIAAFQNCRKTILGTRWLKYSDEFPCWIMRIVRRGRASFLDSGHGEVPIPPVDGKVGSIKEPFIHYPFSHGISDWFTRHIRYAEREAMLELNQSASAPLTGVFSTNKSQRRRAFRSISRRVPMRPALRFAYNYILKGGFRDGKEGAMFSLMKAIYESMIIVKRWELEQSSK